MQRPYLDYIVPPLISLFAGAITLIAARALQADANTYISVSVISSLIGFLVTDKIFLRSRLDQLPAEVARITSSDRKSRYGRLLNFTEALEYVASNARYCKEIRNTRIKPPNLVNVLVNTSARNAMDDSITSAIRNGCSYILVFAATRKSDVDRLSGVVRLMQHGHGGVVVHEIECGVSPLPDTKIQFQRRVWRQRPYAACLVRATS